MSPKKKPGKGGKRKSRLTILDKAQAALAAAFPEVPRERAHLWIGSDAIVVRLSKPDRVGIRFWTGARPIFRTKVTATLTKAELPFEIGPEYDLSKDGRIVSIDVIPENLDEALSRLTRSPHVRGCLFCKDLLEMANAATDDDYVKRAVELVAQHAQKPGANPRTPQCQYPGCVHHEDVSPELARKMIALGRGDEPWRDVRKVLVSTIPLRVTEKDHPKGWDFKDHDVMQRAFKDLPAAAGDIYVRLAPKRTTVHVWISLPYKTRREDIQDVATLNEVQEAHERLAPLFAEWCRKKFDELKGLAEMDLGLGT
ncbi:MAG: hypothetical protein ACRDZ4_17710 [Egibacteraceae bacterium]